MPADFRFTTIEAEAVSGELFLAGSGELALSVAGNVRLLLENPAASGKTLYVVRLDSFATAASFAELLVNPTAGLPAAERVANNVNLGSAIAAVGKVFADTSATTALSGGVDTGVSVGVGANVATPHPLPPLILPPGSSLGLALPFTGAANASVNVYWYEAD